MKANPFLPLLAALGLLSGCAARRPAPLIEPPAAEELVARRVDGFQADAIELDESGAEPLYTVVGRAGSIGYSAEVQGKIARVLRILREGEEAYRWPGVLAVAHRGSAREAPENTLAAIEKAIERGADVVEIDVRESRDGILVLLHDARVDRTTDGEGAVAQLTLDELKRLDAGSWFGAEFAGEPIPTLDEALDFMEGRVLPDIDFKAGTPEKLVQALRRRDLLERASVASELPIQLERILELEPRVRARPTLFLGLAQLENVLERFSPALVNFESRVFSELLIQRIHLGGAEAFFTILGERDNEEGMEMAIDGGVDAIQSDRLDLLVPLLEARGLRRARDGSEMLPSR